MHLVTDTVKQMREYVAPFTTPISRVISHDEGEHLATGTYIERDGRRFLLTNEHVARDRISHRLAPKVFGSEQYFILKRPFVSAEAPVDVAVARIEHGEWIRFPHSAQAVPETRFAAAHHLEPAELLFVAGYTGARARFLFGHLITPGTPYLGQVCDLPADAGCDPQRHFAFGYNPSLAISEDPSSPGLPTPPGLSGSLVWNTRRVQHLHAGLPWTPLDAVVTGVVWGWRETCLIATRIEQVPLAALCARADAER